MPEVSIVIVSWNTANLLAACIDSILACHLGVSYEILVVDNCSSDGSQARLARDYPVVRLIQNSTNLGFSAATNIGILNSRGSLLLLLNSDTLINEASINGMVTFHHNNPNAGIVGGMLLNGDGSFQASYSRFPNLLQELLVASGIGHRLMRGYPLHRNPDRVKRVDWVSGACLMVKREVFEDVGLFDEEYFMYSEEVDFQFRARKHGWSVYYLPSVQTIHLGGASQNRWQRRAMVYRGKLLFYQKHYGKVVSAIHRIGLAMLGLGKLAVWAILRTMDATRIRAEVEFRSSLEVLKLCRRLR
jgi:hypothetical protein